MGDPLGMVGVVLAEKFRVERLLGEGGHGVVYAGTHLLLNAPIAVKFLKVESAGVEQFQREARILFSLSHPAIVRMYDVGELARGPSRMPWVVLELLSGPTLEAEIATRRAQRRHFTAAELRAIFLPVLDGLAFAQARGITHRDIKPANILLSRPSPGREEPKVLDFGTARAHGIAFQATSGNTGFTPMYGAPEQWDTSIAQASAATDVYSIALTMLECATLERAYGTADGVAALLRSVMSGTGRPHLLTKRPDLPPALHEVLDRAMAIYPTARFRDAGELRAAVEQAFTAPAMAAPSPVAGSLPYAPSAPPPGYTPSALPPGYTPSALPPAYGPSAPPTPYVTSGPPAPYVPSGPPAAYGPTHTTSPLMQSQGIPAKRTSSAAVVMMVVAVIGTVILVVGAVAVLGIAAIVSAFSDDDDDKTKKAPVVTVAPPRETADTHGDTPGPKSSGTPASTAVSATPHLSKGVVEVSSDFDMADAARVTQAHYPEIDRCFQSSQKWTGELVLSVKIRTRDGRVVGSTCKTRWHESLDKTKQLPKLDPRASEFCGCVQTQTPAWGFTKPKGNDFSAYDPDDANDLEVVYVAE